VSDDAGRDLSRHEEQNEQQRRRQCAAIRQEAMFVLVSRAGELISRPSDGCG